MKKTKEQLIDYWTKQKYCITYVKNGQTLQEAIMASDWDAAMKETKKKGDFVCCVPIK